MQQGQQQSQLQNVFHKSFPGNNLFEISLVKDTDPNLPFYKNRYFFFVSMTPGVTTDQGGRSFDKNGRINLKTEVEKLSALGKSLRAFARKQNQFGEFAIFTDSGKSQYGSGGVKSCFVGEHTGQNGKRTVTLACRAGQNKPFGLYLSSPEAEAMADFIDVLADYTIRLELDGGINQVGTVAKPQPMQKPNPPIQQQDYQQPNNIVDNFAGAMETNVQNAPMIDDNPFD